MKLDILIIWVVLVIAGNVHLWRKKPRIPISTGKNQINIAYSDDPKKWVRFALIITALSIFSVVVLTVVTFQ